MSVSGVQSAGFNIASLGVQNPDKDKKRDTPEEIDRSVRQDFLNFAKMSVPERIRAQYLKDIGMTEKDMASLTDKQREEIEEKIRQQIEAALGNATQKKVGGLADILA